MASPKKEPDKHRHIPDKLVLAIMKADIPMNPHEILHVILLKTYGCNKKVERITQVEFCDLTGLDHVIVNYSISYLLKKNIIKESSVGVYGIEEDPEKWNAEN